MKLDGRFRIPAPRTEVFARLNDPQFFASCLEGVSELTEIDADHYTATLETRIAYIAFRFDMAVSLVERVASSRVVATLEGAPRGMVGRLSSKAVADLVEADGGRETDIVYEMEVALTGKLGSLGQPVMKSKAKEMERTFVRRASAAFVGSDEPTAGKRPAVTPAVGHAHPAPWRSWAAGRMEALAGRLRRAERVAAVPEKPATCDPGARGAAADEERTSAPAGRGRLDFELARPGTLAEALSLLDTDDRSVRAFSGGTALMLMMKSGVFDPSRLVDLTGLDELGGVTLAEDGGVRIGGLATLAELEHDPILRRATPVIGRAVPRLANVRVRNVARVGGCLAHGDPHMDLPPILASLRATARVESVRGSHDLPVEDLYSGYYQTVLGRGEIITAVTVPPQEGWRSVYRKTTVRTYDDWPALGVAVSVRIEADIVRDARIVVSAATEKVVRVSGIEAMLAGRPLDDEVRRRAGEFVAENVEAIGDVQGSAAYKKALMAVEVRRALEAVVSEGLGG